MHLVDENLIVSFKGDPDEDEIRQGQKQILKRMESSRIRGVLIDVSQVSIIDSASFEVLTQTQKAVNLLGGKVVFVGFQAEVAAALVDLDVALDDIDTAVNMNDALAKLAPSLDSSEADAEAEADVQEIAEAPAEEDRDIGIE